MLYGVYCAQKRVPLSQLVVLTVQTVWTFQLKWKPHGHLGALWLTETETFAVTQSAVLLLYIEQNVFVFKAKDYDN